MSQDIPNDTRDLMRRLDRAVPPHRDTTGPTDGDPVLDSAVKLARIPTATLSQAAQDRIEERLRARMAELPVARSRADARSRPAARSGWRSAWVGWRTLAAALVAVVVVTLVGGARASAASLPGDTLYPVKRWIEGARLATASDDAEVNLHLEFAARRVDEFDRLLAEGDVHLASFEDAARDLRAARDLLAAGHGDPAAVQARVAAVTDRQAALLPTALALMPPGDGVTLQALAADSAAVRLSIDALNAPLVTPAPVPTVTATFTPTPSATSTATATLTATVTATPTEPPTTGTPAPPPDTGAPSVAPRAPTRTPPGHGPTPGLGQNPPGQGGTNPGVGNNSQPPGQNPNKRN